MDSYPTPFADDDLISADFAIKTGILQAGMPVALLLSTISIEYDIVPEFVTMTVLFSTLFSILTLTALLTLV